MDGLISWFKKDKSKDNYISKRQINNIDQTVSNNLTQRSTPDHTSQAHDSPTHTQLESIPGSNSLDSSEVSFKSNYSDNTDTDTNSDFENKQNISEIVTMDIETTETKLEISSMAKDIPSENYQVLEDDFSNKTMEKTKSWSDDWSSSDDLPYQNLSSTNSSVQDKPEDVKTIDWDEVIKGSTTFSEDRFGDYNFDTEFDFKEQSNISGNFDGTFNTFDQETSMFEHPFENTVFDPKWTFNPLNNQESGWDIEKGMIDNIEIDNPDSGHGLSKSSTSSEEEYIPFKRRRILTPENSSKSESYETSDEEYVVPQNGTVPSKSTPPSENHAESSEVFSGESVSLEYEDPDNETQNRNDCQGTIKPDPVYNDTTNESSNYDLPALEDSDDLSDNGSTEYQETVKNTPVYDESSSNYDDLPALEDSDDFSDREDSVNNTYEDSEFEEIFSTGSLELYLGPMYSGKSTTAILKLARMADIGFDTLYINHADDVRTTEKQDDVVTTHNSQYKYLSDKINSMKVKELRDIDVLDYQYIAIDEGQFFPDLYESVLTWVMGYGKHVIVASLDGDAYRRKFGQVLDLIPCADRVKKLKAVCDICRENERKIRPAPFTGRLSTNTDPKIVGGRDLYKAMCRECHDIHLTETAI